MTGRPGSPAEEGARAGVERSCDLQGCKGGAPAQAMYLLTAHVAQRTAGFMTHCSHGTPVLFPAPSVTKRTLSPAMVELADCRRGCKL